MVICLTTVVQGAVTARHDDLAGFESTSDVDVPQIDEIMVSVGDTYAVPQSVQLRVGWPGPAIRASVAGEEETWVSGVAAQLDRIFKRGAGRRWPDPWMGLILGVFFISPVSAALVGLTRLAGWSHQNSKLDTAELVAIAVGVVLPPTLGVALCWLHPKLELLSPGEKPRPVRFRGWTIGAIVTLTLSVVASVIAALLHV